MLGKSIINLILSILFTFAIIGCNNQPVPITDTSSFINALKKAGVKVQIYEPSNIFTTYTKRYVDEYRRFFVDYVDRHTDSIDPKLIIQENILLNDIEESAKGILKKSTFLGIKNEEIIIIVNEYISEGAADFDSKYIGLPNYISFPTNNGTISTYVTRNYYGMSSYYKIHALIINQILPGNYSNKTAPPDMLNKVLGYSFYLTITPTTITTTNR